MLARFGRVAMTLLNCIALLIIFALGFRQFVLPVAADKIYRQQYEDLSFRCNNVMREHFIAKNRMLSEPSDIAIRDLRASEVGLIECQDYDDLRKKLISLGLTENDLARMGLEAMEQRATDVRAFVEVHQIKY
jgi:hypothetical protein